MALQLDAQDIESLDGRRGEEARLDMRVIKRMAEIQGADALMDISGAHIDGSIYQGDASLEFAETLANLGGRVAVPTSLNIGSLDEQRWQEWEGVPPDWIAKSRRIMQAYLTMGCT